MNTRLPHDVTHRRPTSRAQWSRPGSISLARWIRFPFRRCRHGGGAAVEPLRAAHPNSGRTQSKMACGRPTSRTKRYCALSPARRDRVLLIFLNELDLRRGPKPAFKGVTYGEDLGPLTTRRVARRGRSATLDGTDTATAIRTFARAARTTVRTLRGGTSDAKVLEARRMARGLSTAMSGRGWLWRAAANPFARMLGPLAGMATTFSAISPSIRPRECSGRSAGRSLTGRRHDAGGGPGLDGRDCQHVALLARAC